MKKAIMILAALSLAPTASAHEGDEAEEARTDAAVGVAVSATQRR